MPKSSYTPDKMAGCGYNIGKTELLTGTLCSMQIEYLFTVLIMECTEARNLCTPFEIEQEITVTVIY